MSADDSTPPDGDRTLREGAAPKGAPSPAGAPVSPPSVSSVVVEALRRVAAEIGGSRTDPDLLAGLVSAILAPDHRATDRALNRLRVAGVPTEAIVDAYLPAAANALGQGWCDDSLPSAAVTFASARLHGALRRIEPEQPLLPVSAPSVLLILREDETHTFGTAVAAAQFRRAGASVALAMGQSDIETAYTVRRRRFDLVGVSVPAGSNLASLRRFVESLRHASAHPLTVALGGSGLVGMGDAEIHALGGDLHGLRPEEVLARCGLTDKSAPRFQGGPDDPPASPAGTRR